MKRLSFISPLILMGLLFLASNQIIAQDSTAFRVKKTPAGIFSLSARSTVSAFSHDVTGIGIGAGGQFRLQLNRKINTEWFFDYISNDVKNVANRKDYHIGWSVMFYPGKGVDPRNQKLFVPYIVAGHCFDLSRLEENKNPSNAIERYSAAVQVGGGLHINVTPRLDFTIKSQYMLHLGTHIETDITNGGQVNFRSENNTSPEGHWLNTFIVSYKLVDLW